MSTLTGPCRICDRVVISEPGLDGLLCGPACADLYARRNVDRQSAKPGDFNYTPENDVQRVAHRNALRSKQYGSGMA